MNRLKEIKRLAIQAIGLAGEELTKVAEELKAEQERKEVAEAMYKINTILSQAGK